MANGQDLCYVMVEVTDKDGAVQAIAFGRGLKPAALIQQSEDEKYLDKR